MRALVYVVYWKEWRLAIGVSLLRGLLKVERMEVGSLDWNVMQMRRVGSFMLCGSLRRRSIV